MKTNDNGGIAELIKLKTRFEEVFGDSKNSQITITPASLILLGDHTHYNDGILISGAVNRYVYIQLKKRDDKTINIANTKDDFVKSFSINEISSVDESRLKTITALIKLLQKNEIISTGFDCVLSSSIPDCLGLGALASYEVGLACAIKRLFRSQIEFKDLLEIIRTNELNLLGKISNKAHHYNIRFHKEGKLSLIDLRTMENKSISTGNLAFDIVVCDTQENIIKPQERCNERIEECEVGVKGLRLYIWGIKNLRDVKQDFLLRHIHMLPRRIFNRVLYNVNERIRTEDALKLLKNSSLKDFGKIITDSHYGLSRDYELSCEKCDFLVEHANKIYGVYGSKMISCSPISSTFHVVDKSSSSAFSNEIKRLYKEKFAKELITYTFSFSGGLKELTTQEVQHILK